ncbi:hypothetical protein [Bradyrhizobium cenepequi]
MSYPIDQRPRRPAASICKTAPWGAPRINGELLKLGLEVAPQSSVAKHMVKWRGPPSIASMDWFRFSVHTRDQIG